MLRSLRLEFSQAIEFFLLPGLAALLPWRWGFRWLRLCARWPVLYHYEWRPALQQALLYVPIPDPEQWAYHYRLCRLVDHADFWLARWRTRRWLDRHVRDWNRWPVETGPAVGVFFHWCAGLWAVKALRACGAQSAMLAKHFSRQSIGSWIGYLYGHARFRQLKRDSGHSPIYSPGAVSRAVAMLASGDWVIGMPDVPPGETRLLREVQLFGRRAWFAEGLIVIARKANVPIVIFTCALNSETGERELRTVGPFSADEPDLIQRIVDFWQDLLKEKSWAFSLWPVMPSFFCVPPSSPVTPE